MSWMRHLPIHRKMVLIILVASGVALMATASAVLIYEVGSYRPRKVEEARTPGSDIQRQSASLFDF